MARKRFNSKFYNIDFTSMKRINEVPPTHKIVCKVRGELTNDQIPQLKEMFGEYVNDIYEMEGNRQFLAQQVVIAVGEIKDVKEKLNSMGLYLEYDRYTYVKFATDDGTLYSGWKTGRRTKIKPEDLPDTYVRLHNYKKNGYLETAGVVDLVYKPSPFHNHTYKDDFLFISYAKTIDQTADLWQECDEYIFGNDIIDVIFAMEKNNPDLKDKIQDIKDRMVVQYNLYVDEMSEWQHQHPKKIEKLEDIRG